MKHNKAIFQARRKLCVDLTVLKSEAFRLQLWQTGHAIDAATTKIGWEVAELEQAEKMSE